MSTTPQKNSVSANIRKFSTPSPPDSSYNHNNNNNNNPARKLKTPSQFLNSQFQIFQRPIENLNSGPENVAKTCVDTSTPKSENAVHLKSSEVWINAKFGATREVNGNSGPMSRISLPINSSDSCKPVTRNRLSEGGREIDVFSKMAGEDKIFNSVIPPPPPPRAKKKLSPTNSGPAVEHSEPLYSLVDKEAKWARRREKEENLGYFELFFVIFSE